MTRENPGSRVAEQAAAGFFVVDSLAALWLSCRGMDRFADTANRTPRAKRRASDFGLGMWCVKPADTALITALIMRSLRLSLVFVGGPAIALEIRT